MTMTLLVGLIIGLCALAFFRVPLWLTTILLAAGLGFSLSVNASLGVLSVYAVVTAILTFLSLKPLRRTLISKPIFAWFKTVLPAMSETEKEALESGSVWWDAELFSGKPNWDELYALPKPSLTAEEQAFIDGPVEELCEMLNDWEINKELKDLPPKVWEFIKKQRFLSMIIPKEYGGLGFSSQGNAAVVTKISTRSLTAAVSVMVPNSLGPGELLMHFGTKEQKEHYLPRLAVGDEIPCFALTSPMAGSDAASMPDEGVVCKQVIDGQEVLGLRVSWDKRYITLAPIATVLGLAFKTRDPDRLLGDREHLGITCALIPTQTPGVRMGNRHLPGGSIFMNGTTYGDEVFIPIDWVIGGQERVGQGWRMLMHCLAAGRAISLPAQGVAGGKMASLLTGAYARIRYQFKQPIGHFEGIEEPLARIGAEAYRMESAHKLTMSALDRGDKPVVLSAILKAYLTEANRRVINDAMDVHGGKAVVEGPSNYLSLGYQGLPVSITVEGANILTRSMIIFGQGAIRCHPYLLSEMQSVAENDLHAFDRAIWGHMGFVVSNTVRAGVLGLTGGRWTRSPIKGTAKTYHQQINRLSASFSLTADLCLSILGGQFKFKEKLSGRFADALAYLFLASMTLRRFHDDGSPREDVDVMQFAVQDSLSRVEEALFEVYRNFPIPWIGRIVARLCFPWGRVHHSVTDEVGHRIARQLITHSETRERLTAGVYRPQRADGVGIVLQAFDAVLKAEPAEFAIRNALKTVPNPVNVHALAKRAMEAGVISEDQASDLIRAQELSAMVIAVDEFAPDDLIHPINQMKPEALAKAS